MSILITTPDRLVKLSDLGACVVTPSWAPFDLLLFRPLQLWHAYLRERSLAVRGMRPDHPSVSALCNTYERALVSMHKMPRIWLDYLELLVEIQLLTSTRRAFDRALAALPVTQHDRVWVLYLVGV
jgi:hypothetical protein